MKHTIDDAVAAFDRANPVPDPTQLADSMVVASRFLTITEETRPMTTTKEQDTRPPERRQRGYLVAAAVFAVIVIVGLGVAMLAADDQMAEPAAPETPVATPSEAANAFMVARNAGDYDTMVALLAPDAVIDDAALSDFDDGYADGLAWLAAVEWTWTLTDCAETEVAAGTRLLCAYEHENAWSRAQGLPPHDDGGTFEFVVADGEIVRFVHDWQQGTFSPDVWEPFVEWLESNHPDDLAAVLADGCCTPIHTPEARTVWRDLTEQYVAELEG